MDLVGYVSVSSIGQTDRFGFDAQRAAIAAWAMSHGHRLIVVYEDLATGKRPPEDRPGLTDALDDLRPPPKARGLVIPRLDRLARTLSVQEAVLRVAWRAGATVYAADQGEILADDPSDPVRTAMRQMAGVFAELDRALMIKRMAEGRAAKARAGRHTVGEYPFGYRGGGTGRERDSVPDPAEQATLVRILELRDQGTSYRKIAATLDAEGHRPRRAERWSPMSVRTIVVREESGS